MAAGPNEGGSRAPDETVRAAEQARRLLAEGKTSEAETSLPPHLQHLPQKEHLQDLRLREWYALGLFLLLIAELVVVNLIFWKYAEKGAHWNVPEGVMQVFLGATVVQVIGVVAVVTRYLFPRRDRPAADASSPNPAG